VNYYRLCDAAVIVVSVC